MFVPSEQVEYPLSAWDQKYFTLVTFFSDSFQRVSYILRYILRYLGARLQSQSPNLMIVYVDLIHT